MKDQVEFINKCQKIVSEFEDGKIDIYLASKKIIDNPQKNLFDELFHPMLFELKSLAFDIAENYRSLKEDTIDWNNITKILKSYIDGEWLPTYWMLSAVYGKYNKEQLVASYGVTIKRSNGKADIETTLSKINTEIKNTIKSVNTNQTDQRYLQNMLIVLPEKISEYRLISSYVNEYLQT